MTDIRQNWPFDRIRPDEDEAVHDILVAIENELDRIDVQADELQEQRFLDTATTGELEKLAGEVGVTRQTGESEERFRFRALIAKAISRSDGTLPDFAQILHLVFGDDVRRIEVQSVDEQPVTRLHVPITVIEDVPLTESELEDELQDALPMGDGLDILTDDAFVFGESGEQGLGQGELS